MNVQSVFWVFANQYKLFVDTDFVEVVHKEFVLVREDPKDRLDIHICFLKEDRSTRHNLQTEALQETSTVVHFSQKD